MKQSVGENIVQAAAEVRLKAANLDDVIKQKTSGATLMEGLSARIEEALAPVLQECDSGVLSTEVALQKLTAVSRGVLVFVKMTSRNMLADAQQVKGYSEGFATALKLVEDVGAAIKREEDRVVELAMGDEDLEKQRKLGERPETLRVKRKAAKLRKLAKNFDDGSK